MRVRQTICVAVVLSTAAAALSSDDAAFTPPEEFRTIDGTGNNVAEPEWGAALTPLVRMTFADYADGVSAPAGADRPSARAISNAVAAQEGDFPSAAGASDLLWQWGQFLDHDIDLTPTIDPVEDFDVSVPQGDVWFDPFGTGIVTIPLDRAYYEMLGGVREQVNEITSYVDASNVYGSDAERAAALRRLDGSGRLKTSDGRLLPYNERGLPNAPDSADPGYFLAGDFRANEQIGLTAMHTLFVREHNYWARRIQRELRRRGRTPRGDRGRLGRGLRDLRSSMSREDAEVRKRGKKQRGHGDGGAGGVGGADALSGDEIYELARAIVGAEMQSITYHEFLPALLGAEAIAPYSGYDPDVDASIANEFSTAAYRFGHTMLSETVRRIDRRGNTIEAGDLSLVQAFFAPHEIEEQGIEPVLRGMASQRAQEIDTRVVGAVRNFLFGPPGAGGLDLAALNIQRGRDHGLPSYNAARDALGLGAVADIGEIGSDPEVHAGLADVYDDVGQIDLWVGGLAEDHVPGALVGPTFHRILSDQFTALRDGDRFWYARHLPADLVEVIEEQSLSRIIRRNSRIGRELADDVFHVEEGE